MVLTGYDLPGGGRVEYTDRGAVLSPGGRIVKLKVIGNFGYAMQGRDVYPGDVFEVDDVTAKTFILQGRAELVSEEPAAAGPTADELAAASAEQAAADTAADAAAGAQQKTAADKPAQRARDRGKS